MLGNLLNSLSSGDIIAILVVLVGGYFGIKVKSLKSKLEKEQNARLHAESDLRLKDLQAEVERARKESEAAKKNYRNDSDN